MPEEEQTKIEIATLLNLDAGVLIDSLNNLAKELNDFKQQPKINKVSLDGVEIESSEPLNKLVGIIKNLAFNQNETNKKRRSIGVG